MLLAAADRSDPDHTACRELLETHPGPLVTTELVIAETGWLLDRQLGAAAEAALYEAAAASEIRVEPLSAADWTRIAPLTVQYADQHLGGGDSSLIAIAERLDSSCFRNSPPRPQLHPSLVCTSLFPRVWTSPAAPLQQSHDPDYAHPCAPAR